MIIEVKWKGETGTINEKEAFAAAEAIEDHVSVFTLSKMLQEVETLNLTTLAKAYAGMLFVAGFKVDPAEIKREMTNALKGGDGDDARFQKIAEIVGLLMQVLMDGAPAAEPGDEAEKK